MGSVEGGRATINPRLTKIKQATGTMGSERRDLIDPEDGAERRRRLEEIKPLNATRAGRSRCQYRT